MEGGREIEVGRRERGGWREEGGRRRGCGRQRGKAIIAEFCKLQTALFPPTRLKRCVMSIS